MSQDTQNADPLWKKLLNTWVSLVILGIVFGFILVGLYMFVGSGPSPRKLTPSEEEALQDDLLKQASNALRRSRSVNTCENALNLINTHLSVLERKEEAIPTANVPGDYFQTVTDKLQLDFGAMREIRGDRYTLLDARYLDQCLLMRDVARTLELTRGLTDSKGQPLQRSPLQRARIVFDWVVRQIPLKSGGIHAPSHLVLRRGWGTAEERGLIFLDLLRQLNHKNRGSNLLGCMLFCPQKDSEELRLWSCGVLVDDKPDLYLFDPRLGLPLPGPEGKGIATLQEVYKNPSLLEQLNVGDHKYDITDKQVKQARVRLVIPLSAFAPRHEVLEVLLKDSIQVNLVSAALRIPGHWQDQPRKTDLEKLQDAVAFMNKTDPPRAGLSPGATLLRDFYPTNEGGTDRGVPLQFQDGRRAMMPRLQIFLREMAPQAVADQLLRRVAGADKLQLSSTLGERVTRGMMLDTFSKSALEPDQSRDLFLRGRIDKAIAYLVQERGKWASATRRQRDVREDLQLAAGWLRDATSLYLEQQRAKRGQLSQAEMAQLNAKMEPLMRKPGGIALLQLLRDAFADHRSAQVIYRIALYKHEQAEQLQAPLDLLGSAASKQELQEAQQAWKSARGWWKRYTEQAQDRQFQSSSRQGNRGRDWLGWPELDHVQRLHARSLAMLGQRQEAIRLYNNPIDNPSSLERLADLNRARDLERGESRGD